MDVPQIVRLCILVPTIIFVVTIKIIDRRDRIRNRCLRDRFWKIHERRMALVRTGRPCGPEGKKLSYDNLDEFEFWLDSRI